MPKINVNNLSSDIDLAILAKKLNIKPFQVLAIDEVNSEKIKLGNERSSSTGTIRPGNYIINSSPRYSGGKHWTAIHFDTKEKYVHYFDSFGLPPDTRILKWMRSSGKKVLTNTGDIQHIESASCGYWCLYFLYCMNNKISMINFLLRFDTDKDQINEAYLQKFFDGSIKGGSAKKQTLKSTFQDQRLDIILEEGKVTSSIIDPSFKAKVNELYDTIVNMLEHEDTPLARSILQGAIDEVWNLRFEPLPDLNGRGVQSGGGPELNDSFLQRRPPGAGRNLRLANGVMIRARLIEMLNSGYFNNQSEAILRRAEQFAGMSDAQLGRYRLERVLQQLGIGRN